MVTAGRLGGRPHDARTHGPRASIRAMTAIVMDGNALRDEIVDGAARRSIEAAGSPPVCLATVLVGDDPPSQRYVRSKQRKAAEAGMRPRHVDLPATASQGQVEAAVAELAADPDVHGILVQLPLPDGPRRRRRARPDPAGEGRRRPHRAVDGPARARRARPRRRAPRSA